MTPTTMTSTYGWQETHFRRRTTPSGRQSKERLTLYESDSHTLCNKLCTDFGMHWRSVGVFLQASVKSKLLFITARKRSLRRLCFHKRLSFCQHGGLTSRGLSATPGGQYCILGRGPASRRFCNPGGRLGMTPPPPSDTTSGRYTSYWNAFLITIKF